MLGFRFLVLLSFPRRRVPLAIALLFANGYEQLFTAVRSRGLPGGNLLSLLRQRKKAKKGDPRFVGPAGSPALLANAGRCGTRARMFNMAALDFVLALKQSSRTTPAFALLLGDSHGDPVSQRDCRNQKVMSSRI